MDDDYDKLTTDGMETMDFKNIKIQPDFYIHTGILKAQNALAEENVKEGFLKYRVFIEHIEILCKSAGMLPNDYDQMIKKVDGENEKLDPLMRGVKVANKKLELIMKEVFDSKVITDPMKMSDPIKKG